MKVSDPKDTVSGTVGSALKAATDKASEVAGEAIDNAQEMARETGRQARAVAGTVYGQGTDVINVIEGAIRENPMGAILIAGAIGYGLAHFVHRR
jgi:ElaB/YqjD/DUF883 family membrane-anchored ribosome-binding protein